MATKKETLKKVKSLMRDVNDSILYHASHLIESGALPLDGKTGTSDDYRLAKCVLTAAMMNAARDEWSPLPFDKESTRLVKKLRKI